MKKKCLHLATLALLACSACEWTPTHAAEARESEPSLAAPTEPDALALDMFRHLAEQRRGNLVFSPASAEAALRMLQEGARGTTARELAALPYGAAGIASAMQVESANALFADTALPLSVPESSVQRVPFSSALPQAIDTINTWCSRHTHGKIDRLLSPTSLAPSTALVACNAVYLNERWLHPFDSRPTVQRPFHPTEGAPVQVEMMSHQDHYRYAEGDDWQAVALFYRREGRTGEPGCFIGILPKGGARAFAAKLTAARLNAIRAALAASQPKQVRVELPRMEIKTDTFSLKRTLTALGIEQAFSAGADFSGFSPQPLQLSDVVQQCYVRIDESGTEAAAATAAIMVYCILSPQLTVITFDRPFLWIIGDLTTSAPPYFMGICENPATPTHP